MEHVMVTSDYFFALLTLALCMGLAVLGWLCGARSKSSILPRGVLSGLAGYVAVVVSYAVYSSSLFDGNCQRFMQGVYPCSLGKYLFNVFGSFGVVAAPLIFVFAALFVVSGLIARRRINA
jgi:zinc transporter ZupT